MDQVDDWTIEAELGSGDFATVYLARKEERLGALKYLKQSGQSHDSNALARMKIEVEALAALNHPGIPKLLATSLEGPQHIYFVMSLGTGRPLLTITNEWNARRRVFGEVEALAVIQQLLDILAHIHAKGLVHRDIKDANVLVDIENIPEVLTTLIDFGFCKPVGTSDIRTNDSFWRAGSARFAPPSKHDHPGLADPRHDIFAVGVLAYRMLTGVFPWSAGPNDDYNILHQSMLNDPLVPVANVNPAVSERASRFISQLLSIRDQDRPTAEVARSVTSDLQNDQDNTHPVSHRKDVIRYNHVIRDAIHGDIRLTDYEFAIIGTPQFQRLRHIRQLGNASLVYPSADHSRLAHSIGTLDRVEAMFRAIEDESGIRIDTDVRQIARLHGLLHDVCHIPFGHTIEDQFELFSKHDANQGRYERLIADKAKPLGGLLHKTDIGRAALQLLNPGSQGRIQDVTAEIVNGVVGADVLDYLDRDAVNCGLSQRVDSAILRQLVLQELPESDDRRIALRLSGKYGIRVDREFSVESLLRDRYGLYLMVYTHEAKIAADALLGRAVSEMLGVTGSKRRTRVALSEQWFEDKGDDDLLKAMQARRLSSVAERSARLWFRDLPQPAFRGFTIVGVLENEATYQHRRGVLQAHQWLHPEGRKDFEVRIAKAAKLDNARVYVYLAQSAPGYRQAQIWSTTATNSSRASRTDAPSAGEIARRHLRLWETWVLVEDPTPAELNAVGDASESELGLNNVINESRRTLLF